ncbi:MAG: hypothetical protein CM15mP120_14170 [Pseudomonadota bacterium]|nr:MAG: hypothetical protein CM15mP120_14170 [Pseudomonadota bacterium]
MDAALQGDAGRVHKVLHGLKEEGVSVFAIMGALTSQLRRLDQTRGLPPARALGHTTVYAAQSHTHTSVARRVYID